MFVTNKIPTSQSAEAYRALRTNIQYSSIDKKIKTIVVTSSVPGEGKSTVSGNLAFTLSHSGGRVLIIDCDLRKPSMHTKFEISNEVGLTDILVDKCDLKDAIRQVSSSLYIITSGNIPPNPAEIVGSKSMEELIKELSDNFDYIVIDTPPVLAVTDSLLLAAKADATVLVVRGRKAKEKQVKQSYEELTKVRANVIGSVLNDSDSASSGYYKYYGKEKKKGKRIRK